MNGIVRAGSLACKAGGSQAYPSVLEKAAETAGAGTCRPCTLAKGSDNHREDRTLPLAKRQGSASLPFSVKATLGIFVTPCPAVTLTVTP